MKYYFVLFVMLLFFFTFCKAQTGLEFSLGVCNSSQLNKPFNDFYLHNLNLTAKPNSYSSGVASHNDMLYNINTAFINDNFRFEVEFTSGNLKKTLEPDSSSYSNYPYVSEKYSLHISEWKFSVMKNLRFEKFRINIGFAVPVYHLASFNYSSKNKLGIFSTPTTSGSISYYANINESLRIPGGIIWGINNKISIQYSLTKVLYIFTGGEFGLLKANLGGKSNYSYSYSNPNVFGHGSGIDNAEYKSTYLSPLSLNFGVGVSFLKDGSERK